MKKRVLLLEDDLTLNETIVDFLQEQNYEVVAIYDGEDANAKIFEESFDIFLLDVNVPSLNGFELLKECRANNILTPAIFITSLNSIDSFEKGFESGCDDYIRKPFELKELLLRIQSILKREYFHKSDNRLQLFEQFCFDMDNAILYDNDQEVKLKLKEIKLLKLFLKHQNELISHEVIFDHLWDYNEEPSDTSLRTYIKNLRKILGKDRIISVKKLGYRLNTK